MGAIETWSSPIQANFYADSNTVPKAEVDRFLSDSAREVVDYRLFIATADEIGLHASVTLEGRENLFIYFRWMIASNRASRGPSLV